MRFTRRYYKKLTNAEKRLKSSIASKKRKLKAIQKAKRQTEKYY